MAIRQRIRLNQLARDLDASRSSIYRWVREGILPEPHKIGAGTFFFCDEVEEALNRTNAA